MNKKLEKQKKYALLKMSLSAVIGMGFAGCAGITLSKVNFDTSNMTLLINRVHDHICYRNA